MEEIVSVIIPSYNRKDLLEQCLNSVISQDYKSIEILVIDDGSTDGTSLYLDKYFPQVNVIKNTESLGPSFAKNQGILATHGEYVYFLDSDSELIWNNTISRMAGIMQQNIEIGILGGLMEQKPSDTIVNVYGKKVTFDGMTSTILLNQKGSSDSVALSESDYAETCNCFTRRKILNIIGGFDPYYVYMGEDKELGLRVRKLGYKVFFGYSIACLHKYADTSSFDRRYMYMKSKMRYVIKNNGLFYLFIIPMMDLFHYFITCLSVYKFHALLKYFGMSQEEGNKLNPNLKKPEIKWLLMSVYYFMKAYFLNILDLPYTLSARNENFLSRENMDKYQRLKRYKHV